MGKIPSSRTVDLFVLDAHALDVPFIVVPVRVRQIHDKAEALITLRQLEVFFFYFNSFNFRNKF